MNKNNAQKLFSPFLYLFLVWVAYILSYVDNGFGWGKFFIYSPEDYVFEYIIFTFFFLFGYAFGSFLASGNNLEHLEVPYQRVWLFWGVAAIFQIGKFINIGDIPLIGDPMSRYNLTLGGYEDYPSRLLSPISVLMFYMYLKLRKKTLMYGSAFAVLLPLLLMQRQEVVNSLAGILMVYILYSSPKIKHLIFVFVCASLVLIGIVAGLAIARYGLKNIAGDIGILEAVFWIIHGELTTPLRLGAFVEDNIDQMNGLYTLSGFASIFMPGFTDHGAEFIRVRFTDAETAQSVGGFYGYMIDFGIIGIALFSFLSAVFASYFYKKWKNCKNIVYVVLYPVILSQLLWNIRSGSFVISPIVIYVFIAIFYITGFSNRSKMLSFLGLTFIATIPISLLGLIIRI